MPPLRGEEEAEAEAYREERQERRGRQ